MSLLLIIAGSPLGSAPSGLPLGHIQPPLQTFNYGPIPTSLISPFVQTNWPNPIQPDRIQQSITQTFNPNLRGQDKLPPGVQFTALPPQPDYPVVLRKWYDDYVIVTVGVQPIPFNQYSWPLPGRPEPIQQSITETYNPNLVGTDKLPFRQQDWPTPKDHARNFNPGFTVTFNPNLKGADRLPFNQKDWPVPRDYERSLSHRTWLFTEVIVSAASAPFRQQDWPVPRDHQRNWNPGFTFSFNLNLIGKDALPFRQQDWPLPPRGPAPIQQTITEFSYFQPPIVVIGAAYFLLQPHFINNRFLDAWTTVTEGVEIPFGWVPTLAVDPLNVQAVTAFYAAGPRPGYVGPEWNWQNYQTITSLRQNVQLKSITHWVQAANGFWSLTGLGAGLPPVGV